MIVGGYTLDLYCDDPSHDKNLPWEYENKPDTYYGPSRRSTVKHAKINGWVFRSGKAYCPKCSNPTPVVADADPSANQV